MLHNMKTGMLFLSICYVLVGLLLLVMPAESLPWICTALSAVILLTGVVNLIQYLKLRGQGARAVFIMIGGVVATALGVFSLLRPSYVEWVLPVVFGLFVAMDGAMRLSTTWTLLRRHGQKWWVLGLLSLVTLLLALELLTYPFLPFKLFNVEASTICGIILVIEGMLNMGCVIYSAMELHALDRLDAAKAEVAATDAAADASAANVVCEAEGVVVPEENTTADTAAAATAEPASDADLPKPELTAEPKV